MKILIAVCKEIMEHYDAHDTLRSAAFWEKAFRVEDVSWDTLYLETSDFENREGLRERILHHHPTLVFNLFEGLIGNSQTEVDFVSMLESLSIPYTGNTARALDLCLNKDKTKSILTQHQIPVPEGTVIKSVDEASLISIHFPSFIKPCSEDASLGIDEDSLVRTPEALFPTLEKKLKEHPRGLIVEEFIPGPEYNVGFLGNYPYEVLGVSALDYSHHTELPPYLTYHAKWKTETEEYRTLTPSPYETVDQHLKEKIITLAREAGKVLGCRNYFRVDLREKNGKLFVLDVNPNPDINRESGFMRQAYSRGYTYEEVIEKIVHGAITDEPSPSWKRLYQKSTPPLLNVQERSNP